MQEAFGVVIFAVVAIGGVVALITFVVSRKAYDDIGRGAFAMRDEPPSHAPAGPPPSSPAALRERDDEIRQLLGARNERRERKGQAPLDVEAELKRLTGSAPTDPGLRAEVRQLVIARNERRQRAGKERLDVDAEVERQLRELSG